MRQGNTCLPVIIITALDALTDRLAGLHGGADDYLIKPLRWKSCWRVSGPFLRHNGCPLLWLNDQTATGSAKEFAILHELLLEPRARERPLPAG